MRLLNYAIVAIVALFASCAPEPEMPKDYPTLTSLDNTKWYSYDNSDVVFYDIYFEEGTGHMDGFDSSDRKNKISELGFDYTFTPAHDGNDAIVDVWFEDETRYGGILVPKGIFQVSNIDVYLIQLYQLDAEGKEILKDENGNYLSTLQMWME